jgi:xanthine dehydrogenase accessory factor
VTVADARPASLSRDRFPDADTVALVTSDDLPQCLHCSPDDAVVLMTHSYELDRRWLPGILAIGPRYLGLLGPRARAERLFAELGRSMPHYVHAPVGLDIGGDSPAAVALSIVAEIQSVFEDRRGNMLKHKRGPIHTSISETGAVAARSGLEAVHSPSCDVHAGSDV